MPALLRSTLWLSFFAAILIAWWIMYRDSTGMGLDLLGRPNAMAERMRWMDPNMDMSMPMAEFWPLSTMWAIMMAAMMLPTLVPTLRSYEDLMHSANGTRAGWLGLLAGYSAVWAGFALAIAGVQLGLLHAGLIDMLGIATSTYLAGGLLLGVGGVPVHPHQRAMSRRLSCAGHVFPGPLENRGLGRRAHGGTSGGLLRGLLLGVHDAWLCRRGHEPGVDGPCDPVHGPRKTTANRT